MILMFIVSTNTQYIFAMNNRLFCKFVFIVFIKIKIIINCFYFSSGTLYALDISFLVKLDIAIILSALAKEYGI